MTSSPPISKSEEREPWWRRWLEPVVAGAIISTLLLSLVTVVGVVAFQSLKGDLRDVDANLREAIAASETRLRDEMKEFKVEVRADMMDFKAEVKADNRALNEKLDRVLERLPVVKE